MTVASGHGEQFSDVVPTDWTLCVGAACEALGTEAIDYTPDNGPRLDMKLCMDCLRQANTAEGLDFLLVVRGHLGGQ